MRSWEGDLGGKHFLYPFVLRFVAGRPFNEDTTFMFAQYLDTAIVLVTHQGHVMIGSDERNALPTFWVTKLRFFP